VVLFDGLDEVAREDQRRAVSYWVEEQIEQYPGNDFVLTSRPHGYLSAPLNRALVLQVRRFTGRQITRFVHGWCRAVERIHSGVDDVGVAERATDEATGLLKRLRDRPALYELAANPLLLTMIANVHRYRGALPGSRADLLREICEVLLWRREQAKNPADTDTDAVGTRNEIVLRALAFRMMTDRLRDIDVGTAQQVLPPTLSRVGLRAPVADFLRQVAHGGLLVERERGLYAFAHLTLQEHLAAAHILHHRLTDVLVEAVDDDWWRETTLLYAARTDPAPIVEACLASQTCSALSLAFDCADVATEFAPEVAHRLEEFRREALTEHVASGRRRLMTAVTVTRQLQDVVRLGDDTLVSARPVSLETYRHFAADRPGGPVPVPGPSAEESGQPVVGLSWREARDFVDWLNELRPDGPSWRLLTRADVHDSAFDLVERSAGQTVWHLPADPAEDSAPGLLVPEGAAHPWETRPTTARAAERPDGHPDHDGLDERLYRDCQKVLTVGQSGLISLAYDALDRRLTRNLNLADRLAHTLTRHLARASRHPINYAGELSRVNLRARGHARELARDLSRTHDLTPARDLARFLDADLSGSGSGSGSAPGDAAQDAPGSDGGGAPAPGAWGAGGAQAPGAWRGAARGAWGKLDAALDEHLDHASELAHALTHEPQLPRLLPDNVCRAGELVRELSRARELTRALSRGHDVALTLVDGDHIRRLFRGLTRAHLHDDLYRESSAALAVNLAHDHEVDFAPERRLVHVRSRIAALILASLTLLAARGAGARQQGRERNPAEHGGDRLTAPLRADLTGYVVFPEDLDRIVERATARVLGHAEPTGGSPALHRLAGLLAQETAALLGTAGPAPTALDADDATYLDLACRTLAAVAEHNQRDRGLAELYRTAAAGVTVLRQRADGTITPSEVLVLARA
jgi:hypothetical protein